MNRESSSESPSADERRTEEPAATADSKAREYVLVPVDALEHTVHGGAGVEGTHRGSTSGISWWGLFAAMRSKWKTLALTGATGLVLGVLLHVMLPKVYVATTTLMPEYSTESLGSGASQLLQSYGRLLGSGSSTYNSRSNAIRVDLYPSIVASAPLQLKLMETSFHVPSNDTTVDLYTYLTEIRRPSPIGRLARAMFEMPSRLAGAVFGGGNSGGDAFMNGERALLQGVLEISAEQASAMALLHDRVLATLDPATGVVTVHARMEDPVLAAGIARRTVDLLTEYLMDYRLDKVRTDLAYIEEQLQGAKARFEQSQVYLAEFVDGNVGTLSARAQIERERLNSEYTIAFNLYNTLTQQYEQAKLKVQEQTPVFKTLQPVRVPLQDTRSGLLTVLGVTILLLLAHMGWIAWQWRMPEAQESPAVGPDIGRTA